MSYSEMHVTCCLATITLTEAGKHMKITEGTAVENLKNICLILRCRYGWYELMNPSEVFGDIMIDYSYVECSSACITALVAFAKAMPDYRTAEVLNAIQAGRHFLKSIQVLLLYTANMIHFWPLPIAKRWLLVRVLGCMFHLRDVVWN